MAGAAGERQRRPARVRRRAGQPQQHGPLHRPAGNARVDRGPIRAGNPMLHMYTMHGQSIFTWNTNKLQALLKLLGLYTNSCHAAATLAGRVHLMRVSGGPVTWSPNILLSSDGPHQCDGQVLDLERDSTCDLKDTDFPGRIWVRPSLLFSLPPSFPLPVPP